MYCTTNMWVSSAVIGKSDIVEEISKYIHVRERGINSNGHYVRGDKKGLRISATAHGVSLRGSLWKACHGNNFEPFELTHARDTIHLLSDALHLPLAKAKISRVDLAGNLHLNHPPSNYYPHLGNSPHYERWGREYSLYYTKSDMVLIFYDKEIEVKDRTGVMPTILAEQNVLRYEARFKKKLGQKLGLNEVTAATLYDREFFNTMAGLWASEYNRILKVNSISQRYFDTLETITRGDFIEGLALEALAMRDIAMIENFIDTLHSSGKIRNRTEKSRLKRDIRTLLKKGAQGEKRELIRELDLKICETRDRYTI